VVPDPAQATPSVLARHGFEQPEASAAALTRLGAWPPAAALGGRRLLADVAASAHPDLAARALAAIAERHPDPEGFAAALRRRRGFRRRLVAVVAASRSLGTWLAAHPEEADRLAHGRAFTEPRSRAGLVAEAVAVVGRHQEPAAAWDGLRRFKRRELLRIAVRDLMAQARPGERGATAVGVVELVGVELAWLAEACLQAGLVVAARGSGVLVGEDPAGEDPPAGGGGVARLAVVGMGKLGGAELNYVSDVDVVFCHQPLAGAGEEAAARAVATVVRGLLGGLGAVTPEGSCFRVDANLRPEGRNGPLSRTLGSYVAYWERWAQPWEFQALVKARPVAGDRGMGVAWCRAAAERVWPARLDPELVAAIRRTKARVEATAQVREAGERQVKLGPGGLRDIEFAVQLLQLVHGRDDPGLRSGSTLVALRALTAAGLVGREDAARLAGAYRFLRVVEHRLQLAQERRTHTIPRAAGERRWLARTIGYRDGPDGDALDAFEADRRRHAVIVRTLHEKLFYRPLLEAFGAVPAGLEPQQATERLAALGFANPGRAMDHLHALTAGLSRRATILRAMLPVMLTWLAEAPDPDGGLAVLRTLVERIGDRDALHGALRDNPAVAELLCTVLGTSRLVGELLTRHPELLTALSDEGGPEERRSRVGLVAEAVAVVGRYEDAAGAWDGLRRFKRRELLRIAVRDLLARRPAGGGSAVGVVEQVGVELAWLAEACVQAGLVVAARGSGVLVGGPAGEAAAGGVARLAVVGMGKLGGAELNYVSDIDVVFCHEPLEGVDGQVAAGAVTGVVRGLLGGLGAVTPEGACFRVDANLRPEGRNGPLSRTLGSYVAYWDRWAEPWEFQALVKARPVAGDGGLGVRWCQAAARRAWPARLDPELVAAIRRTKARVEAERLPAGADPRLHLKLGPGGLADVEWTVQLLQLRLGRDHPGVRQPGTLAALAALEDAGVLDATEAAWLGDAYRLCLRIRNAAYLVTGRPTDSLPSDQVVLERLARAMGEPPPGRQRLLEAYRRATRRARRVVMARFWEDGSQG
jgi:[glutamine synthetase] adenylyltransferase / [glutamine synthetase]-adenylyl-L-tyrosine phosphorylase